MQFSEYLYIPLITWTLAQAIKFFIAMLKGRYRPSLLFSSGGMPSVHSATVAALAAVALIEGGPGSPLFGITGIVAAIVMYDSLGVRRSAGEQAKALNRLIADLEATGTLKTPGKYGHLREILGHRPLEVVIGACLGVALTCVLMSQTLVGRLPWLLQIPSKTAWWLQIGVAVGLMITGVLAYSLARRGRVATYRPFLQYILISNVVVALLLLSTALLQAQAVHGWDVWWVVVVDLAVLISWHLGLWYHLVVDGGLRQMVVAPAATSRQQRWLKPAASRAKRRRRKR